MQDSQKTENMPGLQEAEGTEMQSAAENIEESTEIQGAAENMARSAGMQSAAKNIEGSAEIQGAAENVAESAEIQSAAEHTPEPQEAECRECGCGCRTKHRGDKEYRDLMNRLRRIEGQIRGIQGMVESDRYCVEILTQVMAVQSALNSFNKILLSNHIKSCVVQDICEGSTEKVDELCNTIQKLMR